MEFQQSFNVARTEMFLGKLTSAMSYKQQPDVLPLRLRGKHTLFPPLELIVLFQNSSPNQQGSIEHALDVYNSHYRPSAPMLKCCHFAKR